MDQAEFLHFDVTGKIIGAIHRVYGKLGSGFPREFYENALAVELTRKESRVSRRHQIALSYDDTVVGEWCADLLIEGNVIVVLTADKKLDSSLESKLLSVLKASEFEVGVVVNFGEKLEFRRKVHSNSLKTQNR